MLKSRTKKVSLCSPVAIFSTLHCILFVCLIVGLFQWQHPACRKAFKFPQRESSMSNLKCLPILNQLHDSLMQRMRKLDLWQPAAKVLLFAESPDSFDFSQSQSCFNKTSDPSHELLPSTQIAECTVICSLSVLLSNCWPYISLCACVCTRLAQGLSPTTLVLRAQVLFRSQRTFSARAFREQRRLSTRSTTARSSALSPWTHHHGGFTQGER